MRGSVPIGGWRGVALIAITYVYFLIFAQFGFLSRLAELGIAGVAVKFVMAAMAIGGILASLLAPGLAPFASPTTGLRIGFSISGVTALLTLLSLDTATATADAFLIGVGLGLLTVTLVTHLRDWTGDRHALMKVGIGTGLGYFACNVPWLFTATPHLQATVAAVLCSIGLYVADRPMPAQFGAPDAPRERIGFLRVLASFAALVWLDSAAFYIIQHEPMLKSGTWMGAAHLWTNAGIHLTAAIAAAYLLSRKGLQFVLSCAVIALGFACILLLNPAYAASASLFYPAGVSLYSVALVAYPAFLTSAHSPAQRGRQAGWIYAVAGWIGSALGIGMGQNLGHVPIAFVAVAAAVVLVPSLFHLTQNRSLEVIVLGGTMVLALVMVRLLPFHSSAGSLSPADRGRQVYISEGCINCHSQYVRPNTSDELLWGPVESLAEIHQQRPPLIGNRRQGPDLAQVGTRRSPLWLKAHLINPAEVSGRSIMPSYAFLFQDQRGDDLVAYLASLRSGDVEGHLSQENAWSPSAASVAAASASQGEQVYREFCATCHDAHGATREQWAASFKEAPANLSAGPFRYLHPSDEATRRTRLAQIAKFGIPGTDMPGHEYLGDGQIASLSLWLAQQSSTNAAFVVHPTGDSQ
jgi:cytochrome c oxidase cbb3-type subunit 2